MRQGESRNRFQLKAAITINRVEGSKIAISATTALARAQPGPSRQAAPMPSKPTNIELGPGAASARA